MKKIKFPKKENQEFHVDIKFADEMTAIYNPVIVDFYIIGAMIEGYGVINVEQHKIKVENNKMFFVSPGQEISTRNANLGKSVFLIFEKDFLDLFFQDTFFLQRFEFTRNSIIQPSIKLTIEEEATFCKMMREISAEMTSLDEDSEHVLRSILYYLLIKINRIYSAAYNTHSSLINNVKVLEFKRLLENEIRFRHSVQYYSDQLGISRTHLNNLSKKFLNKTAKEIIDERLLVEAKRDLLYSERKINEIAFDLCFYEMSNFNRFFKRMTNESPREYRKRLSN